MPDVLSMKRGWDLVETVHADNGGYGDGVEDEDGGVVMLVRFLMRHISSSFIQLILLFRKSTPR